MPESYLDGLTRVCLQKNYAYLFAEDLVYDYIDKIPCKIIDVDEQFVSLSLSLAVAKMSPLVEFLFYK